jgi:hypothetical protein
MKVVLKPGEEVTIEFEDADGSGLDGELTVAFDADAIRVKTDWPDTKGRLGIVYEEVFMTWEDEKMEIFHA